MSTNVLLDEGLIRQVSRIRPPARAALPQNTSLWHEDVPQWRARLGSSTDRQALTLKLCKKPLSQFILAPRAQASRRCETQTLSGKAAKLRYRFGPLTPSARSANLIAGDGTKNGVPAPNKEPAKTKNDHLTGKAPYKFESVSLQR